MAKERKSTKRALVASGISILLCVLMLIGTTLAWFTDQASNKGNRIEAGTLELEVIGYDAAGVQVVDFKKETTPLINEINWEPSLTDTKYILVHNKGTIDLKFELSFKSGDAKLAEALWYYFTPVAAFDPGVSADDVLAAFAVSPMQDLVTAGATGALAQGESKLYRLDYGMNPCAGNEYQGLSFLADIHVVATQDKAGAVINGNIIPVFDEADFLAAVAKVNGAETCPTIILMDNIIVDGNVKFTKPFNLDLNGKALMIDGDLELDINQARGTMDFGNKKTGGQILLSGSYTESVTGGIVFNKNVTPMKGTGFTVVSPGATAAESGAKLLAAVAAANPGEVILIEPSVYDVTTVPNSQGLIITTPGISLVGGSGVILTASIAGPGLGSRNETQIVSVEADNVTLDGLAFSHTLPGSRDDKYVEAFDVAGLVIKNCTFKNDNAARDDYYYYTGIYLNGTKSYTIEGNTFVFRSLLVCNDAGAGTITGNTFTGACVSLEGAGTQPWNVADPAIPAITGNTFVYANGMPDSSRVPYTFGVWGYSANAGWRPDAAWGTGIAASNTGLADQFALVSDPLHRFYLG